jgi:hypothetical protein
MLHPSHSSRFIIRIICGEEPRSLGSSLCSFFHPRTEPTKCTKLHGRFTGFYFNLTFVIPMCIWTNKCESNSV